jgi:hypothetical protein
MRDRVYTEDMGMPPQDIDGASVTPSMPRRPPMKRPAAKKAAPKRDSVFREGMPVPQDIDGASVKTYKSGGKVSSASKRADGCAQRGKTKGKMI